MTPNNHTLQRTRLSRSSCKSGPKIPWAVQETKWVSVYKDGFRPVEHIDLAQKKPIIVKMTKTNG